MAGVGQPIQWPAEAIWEAISPLLPSFTVEVLPEIDSTNSELMRRAHAGVFDPVLLVAERQSAGRGRLGRQWQSEGVPSATGAAGVSSLTFSLGLPLAPNDWAGLSLAVGLCVAQCLHPELRLKWPNDIWLHERKLGGILIETANAGEMRFAVIGIGLNIGPIAVAHANPPPASLSELTPEASAPVVLQRLALPLVQMVQRFAVNGFGPLRSAYQAHDVLFEREVVCSDGVTGVARGVDDSGALLVHTAHGLRKVTSSEVSVRPSVPPGI